MEEQDIKNIWNTYDARLQEAKEKSDRSWALNLRLFEEMQSRKAGSALRKLKILKTTGIVVTVLYLVALGWALAFAISHYSSAWNYFIVSMGAIFIINFKGLSDYVRHLIMASEINYTGSVTEVQQKLSRLQMSIVQHTRFMYLQIPFWSTFYLSDKWFPHSVGWAYIIIHVICTGVMVYAAYWLYTRLTVENMQKSKFIRQLVEGSGIGSVREAMEFYREIEEFKK